MTEPSTYPEILGELQRIVARGKEAEKLQDLGDEKLPKETLDELVRKGRQAQVKLDKFQPRRKYYTEEYPSGPWSRYLYRISTGKPFKEEEFKKAFEESRRS